MKKTVLALLAFLSINISHAAQSTTFYPEQQIMVYEERGQKPYFVYQYDKRSNTITAYLDTKDEKDKVNLDKQPEARLAVVASKEFGSECLKFNGELLETINTLNAIKICGHFYKIEEHLQKNS